MKVIVYVALRLTGIMAMLLSIAATAAEPLHVYIDADRTGTKASGIAIEQGVRVALSEVGNTVAGREIKLIIRDHRGNTRRSKLHLDQFLKDPNALAVFSGLHSPPLLTHRQFINDNRILTLDPWAAAGPITRAKTANNWIFRLSVDDAKAGYVIAEHAIKRDKFTKPYLLLEETGWGKSNERTMTTALKKMGMRPEGVAWFNWGVGEHQARITLRDIINSDADVIFLVANAPEATTMMRGLLGLEKQLPIRSHWGITGGDFHQVIDAEMRTKLDLAFIQTSFSFINHREQPMAKKVFAQAQALFPEVIKTPEDIDAPTGFIHAYDLTKLLISAIKQAGLTGDLATDRDNIRQALESLKQPVYGLIKTYQQPFSPYTPATPDAHEALGEEDFVMARYGQRGEIILEE